jgi:hypothetical protein
MPRAMASSSFSRATVALLVWKRLHLMIMSQWPVPMGTLTWAHYIRTGWCSMCLCAMCWFEIIRAKPNWVHGHENVLLGIDAQP